MTRDQATGLAAIAILSVAALRDPRLTDEDRAGYAMAAQDAIVGLCDAYGVKFGDIFREMAAIMEKVDPCAKERARAERDVASQAADVIAKAVQP